MGDLTTTPIDVVITAAVGYLLGSVPVANLVARRRRQLDLRTVGDRNPGYWNAKETLGRRAALPVFGERRPLTGPEADRRYRWARRRNSLVGRRAH